MDYPYIILMAILLFLLYKNKKVQKTYYFNVAAVIVLLFYGLRHQYVGADTNAYVRFFTGEGSYYNEMDDLEPLIYIYNGVLRPMIFKNGQLYLLVTSFLALYPLYLLIKQESYNKVLSVVLFFLFGCSLVYFIAMRQVLGAAVLFGGVYYFLKDYRYKWLVFVCSALVGSQFHSMTILVFVVFLLAYFIPLKSRVVAITAIGVSATVGIILESFDITYYFSLISSADLMPTERLGHYLSWSLRDNESPLTVLLRNSIVAAFVFYYMDDYRVNHWFSKIYLVSIVLFNLLNGVPMLFRINSSLAIFAIICFTWVKGNKYIGLVGTQRTVFKWFYIVFWLYYLRAYYVINTAYDATAANADHPYFFFFQHVLNNHAGSIY